VATLVDVTGIVIYFEVAAHILRGRSCEHPSVRANPGKPGAQSHGAPLEGQPSRQEPKRLGARATWSRACP
jgi:hypothetical protein